MATHSSALAWRIPGMVEPGGLPSMGSHRVGHDWSDLAAAAAAVSWISDLLEYLRWEMKTKKEKKQNISMEALRYLSMNDLTGGHDLAIQIFSHSTDTFWTSSIC